MNLNSRDLAAIEDYTTLAPEVRAHLTAKLSAVLDALEPYVDGTFELSPAMVTVFLRTCRELGLLYRVYDPPKAGPEAVEAVAPQLALEATRADVMAQLEELAARSEHP